MDLTYDRRLRIALGLGDLASPRLSRLASSVTWHFIGRVSRDDCAWIQPRAVPAAISIDAGAAFASASRL
jgi:hypothetical protein